MLLAMGVGAFALGMRFRLYSFATLLIVIVAGALTARDPREKALRDAVYRAITRRDLTPGLVRVEVMGRPDPARGGIAAIPRVVCHRGS